jgi:ribosomal-protein-alanine N-acetyltransferase
MRSLIKISPLVFDRLKGEILEIERASFPSPWSEAAFAEETKNPLSCFWGLELERSLAGYICFWTFSSEIHLLNIAVRPDKRGQGLGEYMLRCMIHSGGLNRVRTIWLEVRPSNRIAARLYAKIGFQEVGRRPRYYADTGEDAMMMALELPQTVPSRGSGKEESGRRSSSVPPMRERPKAMHSN